MATVTFLGTEIPMLFDAPEVVSEEPIEEAESQGEVEPEAKGDAPASEPASEPKPKEQSEKRPSKSTVDAWGRAVRLDKIIELERDCTEKELSVQDLKEQLKEAKAQLEQSLIRLRRMCGMMLKEADSKSLPLPISSAAQTVEMFAERPEDSPAVAVEAENNEWRKISTSDLLFGIKGLGAKKLEALSDLAPTLGDLEDLRGEASKSHKTFVEVLPKGIGLELASAIEERILSHVAKMALPKPQIELAQAEKTALDDL